MILSVDSGKRTGWALFDKARLKSAGVVDVDDFRIYAPGGIEKAYVEKPEGRGGKTKASPDSLITLALRAGKVAGNLSMMGIPVTFVTPVKWKGSLSKTVCHRQLVPLLSSAELAVLKGVKSKDAWDAVGIGLWALGRY